MKEKRFKQYEAAPIADFVPTISYYNNNGYPSPMMTHIVRLTCAIAIWATEMKGDETFHFTADVPAHGNIVGYDVIETAVEDLFEFLSEDDDGDGEDYFDDPGIGVFAWNSKGQSMKFTMEDLEEFKRTIVSAKIIECGHQRGWDDPCPDIPVKIYRSEATPGDQGKEDAIAAHNSLVREEDLREAILLLDDLFDHIDPISRLQLRNVISILKGGRKKNDH